MGELGPRVGTRQLGPESWDQRAGRVVTRRWDKTVRTGELGLENWDRRVGTIELGESGPESWDWRLGPEIWDLGPETWESWGQKVGSES